MTPADILRRHPFAATFATALVVRLVYDLALYLSLGPQGLRIEDSGDYLRLAADLLAHGDFVDVGAEGGVAPHTQFLPLYPLILAGHMALFGPSPLFPVLTQAVVGAGTCVLVALIADRFDGGAGANGGADRRLGLAPIAGLAAAFNPTLVIVDGLVLTESFFVLFCAVSLYAGLRWLAAPSWRWAILLAVGLGLGVSTRTMLLPWVLATPVLIALAAAWMRQLDLRAAGQLGVALLAALLVLTPMLARNQQAYGTWQLTAQSGTVFLLWWVPLVMEAADGTPHAEGAAAMNALFETRHGDRWMDPFERSDAMAALAAERFAALGAGAVAEAWIYGAAINLLSPSPILSPPVRLLPRTGFYAFPGDDKIDKAIGFLFRNDNPIYGWVLVLGTVGVVLCRLVQMAGLVLALGGGAWRHAPSPTLPPAGGSGRRFRVAAALLLLGWIGFILAVNGPVASPKYRQPAEIALTVFFAIGVHRFLDRRHDGAAEA